MKFAFLCAIACLPSFAFAESLLPKKSTQMLKQYNEFEAEKVKALNEDLLKVKKQVVTALKGHLQETTKKGDLDGSQALIAEIKKWEKDIEALEGGDETSKPIKPDRRIGKTEHEFKYDGRGDRWQNTKIRIEKGQTVSVKVSDKIGLSTHFKEAVSDGSGLSIKKHGFNNAYNLGILLGRLNSDENELHELGKRGSFKAEKTGTLELAINDSFNGDNTGHWDIEITVK